MDVLLTSALIVGLSVLLALGGMVLVRRNVPIETLRETHDVSGFLIGVLGVMYSVLLAFVVSAVWTQYDATARSVEREAEELIDVYRLADGLPEPGGGRIKELAAAYGQAVVDEEWTAMTWGGYSQRAWNAFDGLWSVCVTELEPGSERESILLERGLRNLRALGDSRRQRLLTAQSGLPGLLWVVLVGGGVILVAFTYFFGVRRLLVQALMTASLTAMIALLLFLIEELSRPFAGGSRVPPDAFVAMLEFFRTSGR